MPLSCYNAPGELQIKTAENILINIGLVRLSLLEWLNVGCERADETVIKSPAACQVRFEPGTFRF